MKTKQREKMIMDTKKHENENKSDAKKTRKDFRVFSCGLKTFVLFSVN